MGAPREVWVNVSEDGHAQWVSLTREGATPTSGREPHRYTLARPKREAVAWVVKAPHGGKDQSGRHVYWSCTSGWTDSATFAQRFPSVAEAQTYLDEQDRFDAGRCRVVKLVRPVKP